MFKNSLIILLIALAVHGCCLFKRSNSSRNSNPPTSQRPIPVEEWQDTPSKSTSEIRITTQLSRDNLITYYVGRVMRAGFKIDVERSKGSITTKIKRVNNYYVQLFVSFNDGIAKISGQAGNIGLNGIALGQEPSSSNMDWTTITPSSRGWDIMELVSFAPPNSKVEYNK